MADKTRWVPTLYRGKRVLVKINDEELLAIGRDKGTGTVRIQLLADEPLAYELLNDHQVKARIEALDGFVSDAAAGRTENDFDVLGAQLTPDAAEQVAEAIRGVTSARKV